MGITKAIKKTGKWLGCSWVIVNTVMKDKLGKFCFWIPPGHTNKLWLIFGIENKNNIPSNKKTTQCFQSKQYKKWSHLLEGQWQKFLLHSAALLLLRTLRLLGALEQRPPISTSVLSVHIKKLLISTQTSAEFPDTVLPSCCHFIGQWILIKISVFSWAVYTAPTLFIGSGLFHFSQPTSPMCHTNLKPNRPLGCRTYTGWVLQHLMLWLFCPLVDRGQIRCLFNYHTCP